MELAQLYYFRELARREHLSRTAEFLNLTAPSLSNSISKLERELGSPLFDRVGRNIRLNVNGKLFLAHVDEALDILESARDKLKLAGQREYNILRIGVSAQTLWLDALKEFMVNYPYISTFHNSIDLLNMQNKTYMDQFDFVITALHDLPHPEWSHAVLCPDDQPVLVLSKNHPFSGRKEVSMADIAGEQFVALPKAFSSRKMFNDLFAAAGIQPDIVAEGDYLLRAQILHTGRGVLAISSQLGMTSALLKDLEYIPIISPLPPRVQAIQWRKNRALSASALAFRDFLVEYYKAWFENRNSV